MELDLKQRLTISDGKRIWKHFQRFSEYEDLRDLYNKVVPEIVKFEEKLIDYSYDLEQKAAIIRQFDSNLTAKADKSTLAKF